MLCFCDLVFPSDKGDYTSLKMEGLCKSRNVEVVEDMVGYEYS